MRTSRAWIYVGLGAAAVTAMGLVAMAGPKLRTDDRVLLLGDSFAEGLTVPLRTLAKERGLAIQALSTAGTTIDQWASAPALQQLLTSFRPTIVLISLGMQDGYLPSSPDPVKRQDPYLEQLIQRLEQAGVRAIVWIEPPALSTAATSLPAIRTLIESKRPRLSVFRSQTLSLARGPDSIHPVASSYAQWAGALWQWLS